MNSFIAWVGGKKALRKLIYTMFPVQFDRYIEVFGGGGWVLFGKPPNLKRKLEVYNDYNSNLANLFYCVKNRTCAFLLELGFLPINSRDEFSMIRTFLEKQEPDTTFLHEELALAKQNLPPPEYEEIRAILLENAQMTDVKRAAAFFKLIRYSYGSGCTSFGCQPFDVRKCFDAIWQASHRLSETVIENKDFEAPGMFKVSTRRKRISMLGRFSSFSKAIRKRAVVPTFSATSSCVRFASTRYFLKIDPM